MAVPPKQLSAKPMLVISAAPLRSKIKEAKTYLEISVYLLVFVIQPIQPEFSCCLYPTDILSPKSSEKYILFI